MLNKSHKLHGLTLQQCTPHIQLSVRSLNQAVNLNTDSTTKTTEVFRESQRKAPFGRWKRGKKADIEQPFELREVINYTLDGVSIHPVTTKIQASFLTQLPKRKEITQGFSHKANVDFKTVTEVNGCDRRTLRMDQQHCSYSTILT